MEINTVRVRKVINDGSPLKAIVSVVLDDCLAIHDIKVIFARNKYFVVMPSNKVGDGTFRDIVHPVNREFRTLIEEKIIGTYLEYVEKSAEEAAEAKTEAAVEAEADEKEIDYYN